MGRIKVRQMEEKIIKPETYIALDIYAWDQIKDFLSEKKSDFLHDTAEKLQFWKLKDEQIGITKKEKIYKPVWLIKAYYECIYLRDTIYRLKVDDNVIESNKGDEKLEVKKSTEGSNFVIIPGIVEKVKVYNENKFQIIDYEHKEKIKEKGMLGIFGGKEKTQKLNLSEIKTEKTESVTQYCNEHVDPGFKFRTINPSRTPEVIVEKAKEKIILHPTDAKEILKEEFCITDFKLIFCPFYYVELESSLGKKASVEIDALTKEYMHERF
ncbi:hypothetical protein MSIBF_A930004 [groundwater metagenome]|uniref:Uncharacterized protein n=1 Tax=groundwater metagenome TaxID=717931 RepID=A0A098EDH4_9ZZZZ